jgi:two-component system, cell cycle sensor histidine kinase and response regulator CckA
VSARPREKFKHLTILLADDESSIRHLLRTVLVKEEFNVLQAEDGPQALQIAEGHRGSIQLLVTDIVMPGLNGYEMAQCVRAARPDIKVLYITGHVDGDVGRQCVADKNGTVLSKPFTPKEFLAQVYELLKLPRREEAGAS